MTKTFSLKRWIADYRLELVNFIAGGIVLTFELTASRVVAPYIGQTIYSWTSIIGVILAALAAGYYFGGWAADKRHQLQDIVIILLMASILLIIMVFMKDLTLGLIADTNIDLKWQSLVASLILFAPATFVLGLLPPYLARLSIDRVATSGRHVARISAAGTVGSLVGTFLTGYILFGLAGINTILISLTICLVAASFIIDQKHLLLERTLLLFILALCFLIPFRISFAGVIKDISTRYSRVVVHRVFVNKRPVKVLATDNLAYQSGLYEDDDQELVFRYAQSFAATTSLVSKPKSILVLGGGAFTFPTYLAKNYPDSIIDVVEIDSQLIDISKEYFGFMPVDNINIFTEDGRDFINHNKSRYDLIFVDVFAATVPPFQLFTAEAVQHYRDHLNNGGLVAINLISKLEEHKVNLVDAVVKTYQSKFSQVEVYATSTDANVSIARNFTVLATSKSSLPSKLDYTDQHGSTATFAKTTIPTSDAKVLSDDFAPIEILAAQNY